METRTELEKSLNPLHVGALALGCIIGWGCFVLPGDFLSQAGPAGTGLGLVLGALLMLVITRSYATMIQRFPVAGAEFAYAYFACGRYHAYICGWFLTLGYLSIIPLNATAVALLGKFIAPDLFARGYLYTVAGFDVFAGEVALGSAAILVVGYFNFRSVKSVGSLQLGLTAMLVGTVAFIGIGSLLSPETSFANLSPGFPPDISSWHAIFAIVAVAPWLYVGFDTLPQASEELAFSPAKTMRLMTLAILAGAAMYIVVTVATALVAPWQELVAGDSAWLTGSSVRLSLGQMGFAVLATAVTMAIFTGINGFYMASSRLLFSMGRAKALPEPFGEVHPTHGTPHWAILFAGLLSLAAPWFGRQALLWIVDMSALGTAFGYGYTCLAAFQMTRREPGWERFMAFAGLVSSLGFIVLLTVPGMPGFMSTPSWIALAAWVGIGIVFFLTRAGAYRALSKPELDELVLGERAP